MVRGPLFAGLRRVDWAVFDGTQSDVEALVVRTALRGADAFVGRGQGAEAEWMVRQALIVSPYDERLYRALLRATAAQGNRVGLRIDDGPATHPGRGGGAATSPDAGAAPGRPPADCLHPQTTGLYRDLLDGLPAAGGHPARL